MKKIKIAYFIAIAVVCAMSMASCSPSYRAMRLKRMQQSEEGISTPTTKEELEEAIKKYDARAADLVATQAQEGNWYRLLGISYLDAQLYGKAYEAFQQAVQFYPDNASLYYYIAICAGYIANKELDYNAEGKAVADDKRLNYLKLAEAAYQTSLKVDSKYYKSMYGLGVLYAFDLSATDPSVDYAALAIPVLEQYVETQKRDSDGMFVLARAYYMEREYDKAVALYDQIIKLNPSAKKVADAQANKRTVLDAQFTNK